MSWYSKEELNSMRKTDLENKKRELERELDYCKDELQNPKNDIPFYERLICKIYIKIRDIESELRNL